MIILGLNAFHGDSSACIYKNGELIAATEEERIRRQKHWAGLPTESIKFCLNEAGITLRDVDYITISRDPKAKMGEKIKHVLQNAFTLQSLRQRAQNSLSFVTRQTPRHRRSGSWRIGGIKGIDIKTDIGWNARPFWN